LGFRGGSGGPATGLSGHGLRLYAVAMESGYEKAFCRRISIPRAPVGSGINVLEIRQSLNSRKPRRANPSGQINLAYLNTIQVCT
jgi:hypothetical protein